MDRPTEPAAPPPPPSPDPVQRWRITFGRDPVPPDSVGRAAIDAWGLGLARSGLAIATVGPSPARDASPRARLSIGAPLAAAHAGRAELAELWLLERVSAWALREALASHLPPGHRWVDAEDVWLGAPPLPGQVVAAEWTVTLAPSDLDEARLAAAVRAILAAPSLPRVRAKAGGDRPYDLRPLVAELGIRGRSADRATLHVVTRVDPALGSGRPEEVVAALADAAGLGTAPAIESTVRERLILAEPGRAASGERAISPVRRPPRR